MNNESFNDYSGIADLNENYKNNMVFKDSESIKVHQENGIYSFSARIWEQLSQVSANAYSGPFAVIQEVDEDANESLILSGYNSDKKRYSHNYIDIGIESPIEVAETELELSESGWVFLKITYVFGYQTEIKSAAEFPAQTATELYIRIAYVTFNDDKISEIIQYQYGAINLTGRFF